MRTALPPGLPPGTSRTKYPPMPPGMPPPVTEPVQRPSLSSRGAPLVSRHAAQPCGEQPRASASRAPPRGMPPSGSSSRAPASCASTDEDAHAGGVSVSTWDVEVQLQAKEEAL